MVFAFCPDNKPPRLMRYVDPSDLPHDDVVSTLDKDQNILRINRVLFEKLDRMQKHRVLRTHVRLLTTTMCGLKEETGNVQAA